MKIKFLKNINSLDDLKKAYRQFAKKLHPDAGGSKEDMQQLNKEYEYLFEKVKNIRTNASGETYHKETTETSKDFTNIIDKIINLNVDIEICGSWVWVTGDTRPVKDQLKQAGFKWANNKKAWFWHSPEEKSRNRRKMSLDEIRALHGSESVKHSSKVEKIQKSA